MIDRAAFAALLCDWCLELAAGQQVLIAAPAAAEPLVRALHRAVLEREAWPLLRLQPGWAARDLLTHARERQLDRPGSVEVIEAAEADAHLWIMAPVNTRALAGVDPARIVRLARGRTEVQEARMRRRWCGTVWPTAALAQQAGMAEDDYADFVRRALFLDRDDPAAAWQELSARQAELVARLERAEEIHIEAEGTDLRLRVGARTWVNSDGRRNMPSGEVFTGPIEDSAEGTIRFTIPSSPRGVDVRDVTLRFAGGEVVEASAAAGQENLDAALATDAGARRLGEIGIGTNTGIDRPTGAILLDEKMAGTVHLALGRSYPETGGCNESALHWDLICDLRAGGAITVDGAAL
ncbi:MAG TPA: aminopeptidase [Solirubrobacteraceae bacterium]|nr:aminopeptidase [Solirubrobacteraceae bacterium]